MLMQSPGWFDHVLAVFILAIFPAYAVLVGQRRMKQMQGEFTTPMRIGMYWSNGLLLCLAAGICVAATLLQGRSLGSLGLQAHSTQHLGLVIVLCAALVIAYLADVLYETRPSRIDEARAHWRRNTPFMPVTWREFGHCLVLLLSAGIGEEIIYRGYVIPYLASWTGTSLPGLAVAIALPALVFAAAHLYQGWVSVFKIVVLALIFGVVALLMRSLWLVMLLHVLIDLVGALVAMWFMRTAPAAGAPGDGCTGTNKTAITNLTNVTKMST